MPRRSGRRAAVSGAVGRARVLAALAPPVAQPPARPRVVAAEAGASLDATAPGFGAASAGRQCVGA
eukprot:11064058-Lingulodinium_polyedra.AAC.1